jgi:hypothetical protein
MTQKGVGSAGENSCQASTVKVEASMTHRINAWVKSMQAASVHIAIHGAARITKRSRQLADRDDAMLALCKFRKIS